MWECEYNPRKRCTHSYGYDDMILGDVSTNRVILAAIARALSEYNVVRNHRSTHPYQYQYRQRHTRIVAHIETHIYL
jgi:hypothetical protein